MAILINFLLTIFVLVSLLLILIVLMQRPKSEGLGAAFGGGMTENLFGAQTTNVLANFTRYLAGIFFGLALLLSVLYAKQSQQKSAIQQELLKTAKPVAIPAASPEAGVSPAPATTPAPTATASPEVSATATPSAAPVASATPSGKASPAPAAATPTPKANHTPAPAAKK
jgi:preprotein translocase subunit SecG